MAKLGIDRDFLWEFGKLERKVQDRVSESFAKFEHATHAGAHLETIRNVRDPRLRSIRIDQFWRGVVLAPETGDSYTLLKVLPHDEAYRWARRRRASINSATGSIELRDVEAIEQTLPELAEESARTTERLLADVNDADLRRLGIDEQVLQLARTLTSVEQLEATRWMLPEPQYDALLGLASGMTPEDVWAEVAGASAEAGTFDPDDVTAAIQRSPRQVVLVDGPDELMEVFTYPFALWRIYLHPAQERMATGAFTGPARVTGGPGTGKTVAVLHRAKHLARTKGADRSILVTTFTKTLIGSLDSALRVLVDDEALLRRIDVRHVDQIAYQLVASKHGRLNLVHRDSENARWQRLIAKAGLEFSTTFLAQEWREVVLAQDIRTEADYLAASRRGRGRRLGPRQRADVWLAISRFTGQLRAERQWTYETICMEATRLLDGMKARPYRHIVVDEAQDLSPWQWRMLRAAVAPGPDDLFLAGDTHQRIYSHRVSLKQVGIDIAGRSERLKVNYRTTAEILGWSIGVLHGERVDDMDGNLDTLAGCRSEVHGDPPTLHRSETRSAEMDHLVSTTRRWLDSGVLPEQIGVAVRFHHLIDKVVARLAGAGQSAAALSGQGESDGAVAVTTMHSMKGLEFRCVAVVGLSANEVPPTAAITPAEEDQVTHDLDLQRERCLLFVACTRAREQLAVSWHGKPSELLPAPG